MVNVNVQLPPIVAAPFPQAAESLQRENLLQPAIPKTEKSHAYSKMREHQERENVAHQSSQILQKDSDNNNQSERQSSGFNQRREYFFAKKLQLTPEEMDQVKVQLPEALDYKEVISVIQKKYLESVSPLSSPTIDTII